jgi:hypothetical protein
MNYKNLLLFPFLILLLVCCRHKDDTTPSTHSTGGCGQTEFAEIDSTLIQQFLFKNGTYWIYKDSVDSHTDSVFCFDAPTINWGTYTRDPAGPGMGPCYLHYRYVINSTNMQGYFPYTYYIQGNSLRLSSPFGPEAVFLCTNSTGSLTGYLSQFYPTIIINGAPYSNVYRFRFQAQSGRYKEGYFYMKPFVGIIKSELYTNESVPVRQVYELEKYHIE